MVDMDKFLKRNPSLFHQIEQGKAAILYPGDGMHMLLLGETGVGKSVRRFAVQIRHPVRKTGGGLAVHPVQLVPFARP